MKLYTQWIFLRIVVPNGNPQNYIDTHRNGIYTYYKVRVVEGPFLAVVRHTTNVLPGSVISTDDPMKIPPGFYDESLPIVLHALDNVLMITRDEVTT